MPSMLKMICKCGCGRGKLVRKADVMRGWGVYYSKSCKAKHQSAIKRGFKKKPKQVPYFEDLGFYDESEELFTGMNSEERD